MKGDKINPRKKKVIRKGKHENTDMIEFVFSLRAASESGTRKQRNCSVKRKGIGNFKTSTMTYRKNIK